MLVEHFESLQLYQYASKAWSGDPSLPQFEDVGVSSEKVCQVAIRTFGAHGNAESERYTLNCKSRYRKHFIDANDIVTYDSAVSGAKGTRYATLRDVLCLHDKTADTETRSIECDEVQFEFLDSIGKLRLAFVFL